MTDLDVAGTAALIFLMSCLNLGRLPGKWRTRGNSVDFWDDVKMAEELGCRVDELPVYYGGDLWSSDGDDIGYTMMVSLNHLTMRTFFS